MVTRKIDLTTTAVFARDENKDELLRHHWEHHIKTNSKTFEKLLGNNNSYARRIEAEFDFHARKKKYPCYTKLLYRCTNKKSEYQLLEKIFGICFTAKDSKWKNYLMGKSCECCGHQINFFNKSFFHGLCSKCNTRLSKNKDVYDAVLL